MLPRATENAVTENMLPESRLLATPALGRTNKKNDQQIQLLLAATECSWSMELSNGRKRYTVQRYFPKTTLWGRRNFFL